MKSGLEQGELVQAPAQRVDFVLHLGDLGGLLGEWECWVCLVCVWIVLT